MGKINQIVGNNIAMYRKKMKLTQQELAELVGYSSRSTITMIEKGKRDMPASSVSKFAKALNVTAQDILGEAIHINPLDEFKEYLPYLSKASEEDLLVIRRILGMPKKARVFCDCMKKAN